MSEPTLFVPPDPLATRRAIYVATAAIGAVLAYPVLASEPRVVQHADSLLGWAIVAAWTAAISVAHVRIATGAKSVRGAVGRSVAAGVALGILDSGLSLGTIGLVRTGRIQEGLGGFFMGCLFGSLVGGSRGLAFGIGYAPLVALAVRHREAPTHESRDVARMAVGGAFVAAGALRTLLTPEEWGVEVLAGAFGMALLAVGTFALLRRRRFLSRVRAGQLRDWAVDALPETPSAMALFPATGAASPSSVLYRSASLGEGPYRAASSWTPVARVSSVAP